MATVEIELINATITALQDLITRPPLTEKLLSRPPFKYILDICKAVSASTGFPSPDSCNHDDITEREERSAFLASIISQIETQLSVSVDVQIKSILAGKDVPKTLRMLILLAQAAKLFKTGLTAPTKASSETLMKEEQEKREQERKEQERREQEKREQERREQERREQELLHAQKKEQKQEQEKPSECSPKNSPSRVRFADTRSEEPQLIVERPHYNPPPPSQHSRRMAAMAAPDTRQAQPSSMRHIRIIKEESSNDDEQTVPPDMRTDTNFAMGLDGEWGADITNILSAGDRTDGKVVRGELISDILDIADKYNTALYGEDAKKLTKPATHGDQRTNETRSQPVQKLISHISSIIGKSVPYTKSTAFLDEHILAMKAELNTASDNTSKLLIEVARQNNGFQQVNSACDSKLHRIEEELCRIRHTQLEMLRGSLPFLGSETSL